MVSSVKINYYTVGGTLLAVAMVIVVYNYTRPELAISRLTDSVKVNLKELLSVSIELAEAGGYRVVDIKTKHTLKAESKGKTKEGKDEMKTEGDMESHRAIMAGFNKAFPELQSRIVSEEHDKEHEDPVVKEPSKTRPEVANLADLVVTANSLTIWVDPLDATQEYTEDLDQYVTVMICVAVDGVPTIGVIHRPQDSDENKAETVWGWVGYGASDNLHPSKTDTAYRIIISRSHTGDAVEELKEALGEDIKVTPAGGAGYKIIEVVRGNQDAYIHVTAIKKWDICPGHAILRAVSGEMKTLEGNDIRYDTPDEPANLEGLAASMSGVDDYITKLKPVFLKHVAP